jgi:hypothetical protein
MPSRKHTFYKKGEGRHKSFDVRGRQVSEKAEGREMGKVEIES